MAKNKRVSGIDIDEDVVFQVREWRVQHVGWVVIWRNHHIIFYQ